MASHAVSRPVVVDVTSDETGDLLRAALGHGFDVVLANKKPLAGSWESYDALVAATATAAADASATKRRSARGCRSSTRISKLVETGDRVLRIEGCVSGTLMYVVSAVSAGRPFSEAVREAVERGYAEPDPRDDLSGRDAARKALILARLLGYRGPAPDAGRPRAAVAAALPLARVHEAAAASRRRVGGASRSARPRAAACCATS